MKTLREQFLDHLRNKSVTAICSNGYQLKGTLARFDDSDIVIRTTQYGTNPKEALCTNFLAVIPENKLNAAYLMPEDSTMRQHYLHDLKDTSISCFVSNGFELTGILVAYDEHDIIVKTPQYGGVSKHVLVTNFTTVISF